MLTEWLLYLAADCPQPARKLGYLRESIAIRSRYRRCRSAWQPHLEHSRAALLDSLQACTRFRTALVFGSGLLLDIPLDELARRFEKVYLVDVVHLPEVRRIVRRYANVLCISHDVTGFMSRLDTISPQSLDLPPPERFLNEPGIDWIASVNLLSQLPLLPLDWLRRRFPELDEATLETWGIRLMRQHLDYLAAFAAPTCLLADMEQTVHDRNDNVIEKIDFAARLGFDDKASEQWRWDIAPPGEIAPGIGSFHRVAAHKHY
ncbi:MAG: hypothetical protein A2061_09150 [Gallionellales bacterium GWA2_59_43]|nr:MAG: hypothetical protein A2061_09150 [Gallionellales bacterium GWA2_59_43]